MEKKSTNRTIWLLTAFVIAISIIDTGMAFSLSPQSESSGSVHEPSMLDHRPSMPTPTPLGVKLLLQAQELNILSQLTGKPVDIIKEQTRCKPMPEFLEENGITPELFRTVMDEQAKILVKQASVAKIITKEQEDKINEIVSKFSSSFKSNKRRS